MTDPWIDHKDCCAQCGAQRVMIADGLCRACWRDTNGDAEMEKEDLYGDLDLEVVGYYFSQRIENSDCNLPEDVGYTGLPDDLDWDYTYYDIIDPENGQIRDKYKDL